VLAHKLGVLLAEGGLVVAAAVCVVVAAGGDGDVGAQPVGRRPFPRGLGAVARLFAAAAAALAAALAAAAAALEIFL